MATKPPIHERLAAHVIGAGLSNAQLADKLNAQLTEAQRTAGAGWSEMKVWRVLTGRTEATAAHVEAIAKVLKKTAGDLYQLPEVAKAG